MSWSQLYPACLDCGRTDAPHAGKGLCTACRERRTRTFGPADRDAYRTNLTAGTLEDLYLNQGLTLEEIGRRFRLSRQAVYYRMRQLGISRRTRSEARRLSLGTKAIEMENLDAAGATTRRILVPRHVDSSLFETWSPAMA